MKNCQHRSSFESALNRWTLTNQSRSSDTLKFNTYIHISIIGKRYYDKPHSGLLIDCGAVDQNRKEQQMTKPEKTRPYRRQLIPANGFWIRREVDPIAANNEHYDDWWEYQYVNDTLWKRIQTYQQRQQRKWSRWDGS